MNLEALLKFQFLAADGSLARKTLKQLALGHQPYTSDHQHPCFRGPHSLTWAHLLG